MKGWTPADLPPMVSTWDEPVIRLSALPDPPHEDPRDRQRGPLPDYKRNHHNAKLKGWQKGKRK